MFRLKELMTELDQLVPIQTAQSWDKVGLQVGDPKLEVTKVLVALDLHEKVLAEALEVGAQLVVTHHPLIFTPLTAINSSEWVSQMIYKLIESKVALYVMHTNLDQAESGLNDQFGKVLGLSNLTDLDVERRSGNGIGKLGQLVEPCKLGDLLEDLKQIFNLKAISFVGDANKKIKKIGVCTGAGGGLISAAVRAKCDLYITGDLGYHKFQEAERNEMALVNIGHYVCERKFLPEVTEHFNHRIKKLEFICSKVAFNPEQVY